MNTNKDNLIAASLLLHDFYAFDARLCTIYSLINGDGDETTARLRQETDRVEAIIKQMIETAALEGVAA